MPTSPGDLLAELVRAPSVTPLAGPALDVLERHLAPAGFAVDRPVFEESGTAPVENLFAAFGSGEQHLTFAGHADVVPPGPEHLWKYAPFSATVVDGILYGRGAVDMKGGLAAMSCAAIRFAARRGKGFAGRLSLLVTSDEEGAAINGTAKLLEWAAARGERFSAALVGEPTSARALGDQIKIGRRGSFSATLTVEGKQGHAAYPEMADNPVHGLIRLLQALRATPLDGGSEHFGPSSLEIVSVDVGNPAWNVIPASASARFNSRCNDNWTGATLRAEIERRLADSAATPAPGPRAVKWHLETAAGNSDAFLTRDEGLIRTLSDAIEAVVGKRPAMSTSGGTSDARFIRNYCPVVEFGLVGGSMHQIDEHVALEQVEQAARIYETFLDRYFEN